jgi:hypothetical protein
MGIWTQRKSASAAARVKACSFSTEAGGIETGTVVDAEAAEDVSGPSEEPTGASAKRRLI